MDAASSRPNSRTQRLQLIIYIQTPWSSWCCCCCDLELPEVEIEVLAIAVSLSWLRDAAADCFLWGGEWGVSGEACLLEVREIRFVTCDLEREQSVRKGSRRDDVEREREGEAWWLGVWIGAINSILAMAYVKENNEGKRWGGMYVSCFSFLILFLLRSEIMRRVVL